MKARRIMLCVLVLTLFALSSAFAQVPSFSSIVAAGNTCQGIDVSRVFLDDTGERFTYTINVGTLPTFNGHPVESVGALYVYPNLGKSFEGPDVSFTPSPVFPNWQASAYDTTDNGFAYFATSSLYTLKPGESGLVGIAFYTTKPFPQVEANAVLVIYREGGVSKEGICITNIQPPIVPEPGSLALFGLGLAPFAGLIRRRK